jgi:zinc protease
MTGVRIATAATLIALAACTNDAPTTVESQDAAHDIAPSPIVLLPVPSDPTIAFSISFGVGSQDDPVGKEGLAYLTGQMVADASTEANAYDAILEALYPIASSYSARVDKELTTITGRTHRDNVEVFFGLLTDAYLRPAFAASDFERIKNDTINYLENTLRFSSDEELAKAVLTDAVFAGTRYAHPIEGTLAGLRSITLADVSEFYRTHYTAANATLGLAGGFDDALVADFEATLAELPVDVAPGDPAVEPAAIEGTRVVLIDKEGADASISFGFPLDVKRGERDFYALWIANSWLGEHRNQAGQLFKVIRGVRGLNYGNYSYLEAFPEGGRRQMPPVNVARRQQLFEVWIRTLPNEQALFALRAAINELDNLIQGGMTDEEFELTRAFLDKYVLHFAETMSERLGYALDDRFYDVPAPGHLARFREMLADITRDEVNAALQRYLRADNLVIAIVTGDAAGLRDALVADAPTSVSYATPQPDEVLAEDETIAVVPLNVAAERIEIVPVERVFER